MNESIFDKLDFGPLRAVLDNDDITDISFDNNGQIWIRSLTQGSLRVEIEGVTPEFIEKLAFQCSNVMGTTFNNAKPFLDAESAELRLNFVHQSIATNGIAMVIRKTPAKIRLEKEKLLKDDYFTRDIHDTLIKCVEGHCNIIVCGETGSGKTEFVKYLASHTKTNEKIITIEDTLELHLDKIFPQRDIVAMKTNNVASYTDVLVTCMRQNPKWILLSEVRSAEAVSAVRNSISSGHNILSTIHADKASAIPYRLYSLMETDLDVNQFLTTIYRYIQLGVHIKAYYSKERGKFHREVDEVVEFYVDENNKPQSKTIYQKLFGKEPVMHKPSPHLIEYLANQNIDISDITSKIEDDPFEYNSEQTIEKTVLGDDIPIEKNTDSDSDENTTTDNTGNTKTDNTSNVGDAISNNQVNTQSQINNQVNNQVNQTVSNPVRPNVVNQQVPVTSTANPTPNNLTTGLVNPSVNNNLNNNQVSQNLQTPRVVNTVPVTNAVINPSVTQNAISNNNNLSSTPIKPQIGQVQNNQQVVQPSLSNQVSTNQNVVPNVNIPIINNQNIGNLGTHNS